MSRPSRKGRRTLAANLRKIRLARSLSQEKLAELADLHRTYISDIERAQKNISIDNIEKLARALHCRMHALLLEE